MALAVYGYVRGAQVMIPFMKRSVSFGIWYIPFVIFAILAMVRRELQKQRRITDYNNLRDRVTSSGSYEEALAIIRETVNLIDDDGMK